MKKILCKIINIVIDGRIVRIKYNECKTKTDRDKYIFVQMRKKNYDQLEIGKMYILTLLYRKTDEAVYFGERKLLNYYLVQEIKAV